MKVDSAQNGILRRGACCPAGSTLGSSRYNTTYCDVAGRGPCNSHPAGLIRPGA